MVIILKGTVNEKRLINEQEDLANDAWFEKLTDKKIRKWFKIEYKKSAKLRELEGGKKDDRENN